MTWFKCRADLVTHARIARAGPDGFPLFMAALCQHASRGSHGTIPAHHSSPEALRIEAVAVLGHMDHDRIAQAILACVAAGLLVREDDGALTLAGLGTEDMPTCSHCRKPNPVPRWGMCPKCRGKEPDAAHMRRNGGATAAQPRRNGDAGLDRTEPTGQDRPNRLDPEPEPDPLGDAERADRVAKVFALLMSTGIQDTNRRRDQILLGVATEVVEKGIHPEAIRKLWERAQHFAKTDPSGMLRRWIEKENWSGEP